MKRLATILATALLALEPAPILSPAALPAVPLTPEYAAIYLSTAISSGSVVQVELPADLAPELWQKAPIIERPGMERRIGR